MREQIAQLKKEVQSSKEDISRYKLASVEKEETLELVREELTEAQVAFQRDLDARNQAIDKFKDTIRKQRSNIAQGESEQVRCAMN